MSTDIYFCIFLQAPFYPFSSQHFLSFLFCPPVFLLDTGPRVEQVDREKENGRNTFSRQLFNSIVDQSRFKIKLATIWSTLYDMYWISFLIINTLHTTIWNSYTRDYVLILEQPLFISLKNSFPSRVSEVAHPVSSRFKHLEIRSMWDLSIRQFLQSQINLFLLQQSWTFTQFLFQQYFPAVKMQSLKKAVMIPGSVKVVSRAVACRNTWVWVAPVGRAIVVVGPGTQ